MATDSALLLTKGMLYWSEEFLILEILRKPSFDLDSGICIVKCLMLQERIQAGKRIMEAKRIAEENARKRYDIS
jgi:hypothetical protein